jgi:hypothetical protein
MLINIAEYDTEPYFVISNIDAVFLYSFVRFSYLHNKKDIIPFLSLH